MRLRTATSGFVTALTAGLFVAVAAAEMTRIEVETRADVADGAAYGLAGAYEKLAGRLHFAIDPNLPVNAMIRDIGYATANDRGLVELTADFYLLKPKDITRGNGALLFEVSNRGRKGLLPMLEHARSSLNPESAEELGDGLLLRNGFTLLWVGWQFDVPDEADILRVSAPIAGSATAPLRGLVRSDFVVRTREYSQSLADRGHRAYPALALHNPADTLTVRDTPNGARRPIPRDNWRFARIENGREIPDPTHVTLEGGFDANKIYEVVYESENPPVAGSGFAAIRDAVSRLKYGGADELGLPQGSVSRAIAFGISQSGRVLRTFLYEGFNADERGRKVFDGVIAHIAGGARGSFNHRFAQPSRASWSYHYPHAMFPFTDAPQTDPSTGESDGLLAGIPAEAMPKVFHTNSSNEYWRGIAALVHISADGKRDVAPPDNVRLYFLAGTQHVPAAFPPVRAQGQQPGNPNDYGWFLRRLVLAMDDWIQGRANPPASRYPTLAERTLIERSALAFPRVPGVNVPADVAAAQRIDYGPDFGPAGIIREPPIAGAAYPALIPQVNADGNETSGLISPELAVPLATSTGWNLFDPRFGPEHELVSLQGSYVPFARTARQRTMAADPRPSIEERYSSRAEYLGLIAAHTLTLIDAGYVLAEDLAAIVAHAGEHWDRIAGADF